MIYIDKGKEPEFLTEFKRKHPGKTYDDKEFDLYRNQLTEELIKEQKGLCAYCCALIRPGRAHNEHIEPRHPGKFESKRTLDYTNLVASCNNVRTCGKKKGNNYEAEKFVSPLDKKCEDQFTYYLDGEMDGDDYTINLLNLNDYELKEARKATCRALQNLDKKSIEEIYMNNEENHNPYFNVIKWYINTL